MTLCGEEQGSGMITFLKGTLTDALPTQAVIDVNGIGYEVLIPLSSFEKLAALGQAVSTMHW